MRTLASRSRRALGSRRTASSRDPVNVGPGIADPVHEVHERHHDPVVPEVLDAEIAQEHDGPDEREDVREHESARALQAAPDNAHPDVPTRKRVVVLLRCIHAATCGRTA